MKGWKRQSVFNIQIFRAQLLSAGTIPTQITAEHLSESRRQLRMTPDLNRGMCTTLGPGLRDQIAGIMWLSMNTPDKGFWWPGMNGMLIRHCLALWYRCVRMVRFVCVNEGVRGTNYWWMDFFDRVYATGICSSCRISFLHDLKKTIPLYPIYILCN